LDKEFADFEYCTLKAVNRSYKYVSTKVKLFQVPITKVKVCGRQYVVLLVKQCADFPG